MEHISFQTSSLLGWLFDSTICISILICLILTIKAVAKGKLPAWWSYGLWLLLLLRMVMPWGIESRMSIFNYLPAPLENGSYKPFLMERDLSIPLIQDNFNAAITTTTPTSTVADPVKESANLYYDNNLASKESNRSHYYLSMDNVLLILWFTGVMFFGTKILFKNFMFWLTIRGLPSVKDKIFLDLFDKCRVSFAIRKNITIIVTDKVKSPALFGFFKPRLLLPPHFLGTLQRDELRYVFLHELSHLKRHDICISWLVTALQIVHWFNPLVWYAFHHLRVDQEAACDAYVLSRIKQVKPTDYAYTIVSLLERFIQNRQLPSLVGIIENRSQINRRITMIVNFKKYTLQRKSFLILMFFIVGLLFFTSSRGDADIKKAETAADFKESHLIMLADNQALSEYENKAISSSESEKEHNRKIDIALSNEVAKEVKDLDVEEAETSQASVKTKKVKTQVDRLMFAANKRQEALSENKTPDIIEPERAIEHSESVQQPQDPSLDLTSRGLSHLEKGQINDAVSAFNKAIELNPGNSVAYFSRGRAYFKQGKIENAISDYNRAIEISPEFTRAYAGRGYMYYKQKKFDNAISDYNKAIELDPESANIYNMRGSAYYEQRKLNNAISDYSKAIEINPEFSIAYLNRGLTYHIKHKREKARSDYDKVIDLNPKSAIAKLAKEYRKRSNRNRFAPHISMGSSGVNIDHNDAGSAAQHALSMSYAPPVPIR